MKYLNKILVIAVFFACAAFAESPERQRGGTIRGTVIDSTSGNPVAYAEIIIRSLRNSGQVTGTITGDDGDFVIESIRPGRYEVEVFFLGYSSLMRMLRHATS